MKISSAFCLALTLVAATALRALAGPKEDLIAADKAFSAMSVAKGSNAAFLVYMADDATLFGGGNQPPIFGKAEAEKRFADPRNGNADPKTNVLSWIPDRAEASADGTFGYTDGRWLFEGGTKEKPVHLTGHYVTVWRKTQDGWKVVADMGDSDPPPKN